MCLTAPFQAVVATALTQPVDVMKTRLQNAKPGEFSVSFTLVHVVLIVSFPFMQSLAQCFCYTANTGPLAFFKVSSSSIWYYNIYIDTSLSLMLKSLRQQGFIPAFVRLGPHTILTFIFLEKLRILLPPKLWSYSKSLFYITIIIVLLISSPLIYLYCN